MPVHAGVPQGSILCLWVNKDIFKIVFCFKMLMDIILRTLFQTFQILIPCHFPNQSYMVSTTFQKQNSKYFPKCLNYFTEHFPRHHIYLWISNQFAQI